jgi:hypothetical protein
VVGDYVLEMYESQLNYVSETEVCLKDQEIKRIKEKKDEEIKKLKEEKEKEKKEKEKKEKDEEIKRKKKEKDEEIRKLKEEKDEEIKIINEEKDKEIEKLKKEKEKKEIPPQEQKLKSIFTSSFQSSSLITVNSVVNPEIEFIKPLDDVKIEGRTITFTKDNTSRTVFINKMIDSGIVRMFISFSL